MSETVLKLVSKLLVIGGMVAGFVVIVSGGDGRYADGNIKTMCIAMLICIACSVSVKLINKINKK